MKVIPKTLLPKIKSGNHGEIFFNKINELIVALGQVNVVALGQVNLIAFKENVNLKNAEDIDIDFVSGKNATNTIPQFVIIEKANSVDVYSAGSPATRAYIDVTITGGLVQGQVIEFQGVEGQLVQPGGYTIPSTPTIAGVVSAIVTQAATSQYTVTQINSSTFRVMSSIEAAGVAGNSDHFQQLGNSTVTYTTSNVGDMFAGGTEAVIADMNIKLDSIDIAQGYIDSCASLIYQSNKVYATHSTSIIPSATTSKYILNKVVPCNNDFYVNIYICGISLE